MFSSPLNPKICLHPPSENAPLKFLMVTSAPSLIANHPVSKLQASFQLFLDQTSQGFTRFTEFHQVALLFHISISC